MTGAGMGAKSPDRRNFEAGILTTDPPPPSTGSHAVTLDRTAAAQYSWSHEDARQAA